MSARRPDIEQPLKRRGRLWFFPDGSMYVYYTPTHWAEDTDYLRAAREVSEGGHG